MGREPTSLSCHTCRSRRIKCDLARPSCQRCLKSGRDCQGYEKLLRVNIEGIVRGSRPDSSRLGNISRATSYPTKSRPTKDLAKEKPKGQRKHASSESCRDGDLVAGPPGSLPSVLDLSPFIDNVAISYLFTSYSWINLHSILLQDTPMRQRLALETDELGYDSLRALSYGIFARDHQIDSLRHAAARVYGRSLVRLQSSLGATYKRQLAQLIKPIALLGSYLVSCVHIEVKTAFHF
jgi:hypothetical protein